MISNKIIKFIKKLPYWQQLLSEQILNGTSLSEEKLDNIYSYFKKENRLCDDVFIKKTINHSISDNSNTNYSIKWRGLKDVFGVNALKNDQQLKIGNNITLVYGENGSGKSGYTRILNNIFISRGDKSIIPNIFVENVEDKEKLNVKIIFEDKDGNLEEHDFNKNKNHTYYNSVSVFDTISANNDLTRESEPTFAPTELKFFELLVKYSVKINDMLDQEIMEKTQENTFINYFDKETEIKKLVSELNSKTKINEFKTKIEITEKDIQLYEEKIEKKIQLKALKREEKVSEYNNLITYIKEIKKNIEIYNSMFSLIKTNEVKELLEQKYIYEKLLTDEGLLQFENYEIEELGSIEWKSFISAANDYYKKINTEINTCIFCRQKLDDVIIIDKYWKYLTSLAEINVKNSNNTLKIIKEKFKSLHISIFVKESKIDEWLKKYHKKEYELLIEAECIFKEINKKIIKSLEDNKWDDEIKEKIIETKVFDSFIVLLKDDIYKLDSEKIRKEIEELTCFENEYIDKIKIRELNLISKIELFVKNSLWVDKAVKCRINTTNITMCQRRLFSKYVTEEYINKFNNECKTLNSEFSVEINQRGKKGYTLSKLTVKGKKPIEILSEGEQRSIALANFLAETSLDKNNICIILDDPVSSLDHKRRELISNRLVEESKKKQVVIFTHDLTFMLSLKERCEKESLEFNFTKIIKINNTTGIIQDDIPWIGMPVSKRITYQRDKLQKLKKQYKQITPETPESLIIYQESTKTWCMFLRETWERIIEEILLNGAVERFSPAIQTQRLLKATFTRELYETIEKGMYDCSNWVHDRASGLGEYIPKPEELELYLNECEQFIKKNRPK